MNEAELPDRARVLVAGAGPVGLTAALLLARAGIDVVVLEAADNLVEDLRTTIVQPSSLEVWHALGATEGLIGYGTVCRRMQFRERETGVVANLAYDCLDGETSFPHIMLCALPFVVPELHRQVAASGHGRVFFGARVESVGLRENSVEAFVNRQGTTCRVTADFMIAADGTRSVIRDAFPIHRLRIAPGNRLYRMTVGDPVDKLIPDVENFSYVMDSQCYGLILKNPGFWRIPVGLGVEVTDDDDNVASESTGARLIRNFMFPGRDVEITASRPLVVTNWVASEFGVGNILFAGDSAHAMNPMAGLGMNSGVLDAVDAALAVVDAHRHGKPGARWAKYVGHRARVAHDIGVRALTRYTLLTEADPQRRQRRNEWLRSLASNDRVRRDRLKEWSLLDCLADLRPELEAVLSGGVGAVLGARNADLIGTR